MNKRLVQNNNSYEDVVNIIVNRFHYMDIAKQIIWTRGGGEGN